MTEVSWTQQESIAKTSINKYGIAREQRDQGSRNSTSQGL